MHLFFGIWFLFGFFAVWTLIFLTSRHEWNKKGHEKKSLYEEVISVVMSGVMAFAIALSVNAVVQFIEYLPDGADLTGDKTDKSYVEKQNLNVFKNVSPGSNTFNEFAMFFYTPVTIMLGFLAILFIVKIDTDRLKNERRHNRKKAEDNLCDTAHYGIELLRDFDTRHIDFFVTKEELGKKYLIDIDTQALSLEPDFQNLLIVQHNEQYISQELIKKLYFMSTNKRLRHKKIFVEGKMVSAQESCEVVLIEGLRKIYYSSMATIFAEHVKRKTTDDYSDIGDDVAKIQNLLEEVFLRSDFDIKNPNNEAIVKIFLKIEHGVRDFYDVQSGIFVQNKTVAQDSKNNRLQQAKTHDILVPHLKEATAAKSPIKECVKDIIAPIVMVEKTNISDIREDAFKTFNKRMLKVGRSGEFDKIEKLLAILYANAGHLLIKGNLLLKIMEVYKNIKVEKREYKIDEYILNGELGRCELIDFLDFYKALKKTHKNQFGRLFEKMVAQDKAAWRDIELARRKGHGGKKLGRTVTMTDAIMAGRCLNIFIKIWRECQSYYNYFDLFKNLHELRDALLYRDKGEDVAYWVLSFDKSIRLRHDEKSYLLQLEWFKDANYCDYGELLQIYFTQQLGKASQEMYKELFGDEGVLKNINIDEYQLFLQALQSFLRDNYIEQAEFGRYQEALRTLMQNHKQGEKNDKPT